MITTGIDGRVRFMNKGAQLRTGWSDADALDKPLEQVFAIVEESTQQPLESPVRQVIERQQAVAAGPDTTLISREGRRFTIELNASPVRDERGALIGVVIVFRDIEQRTATEKKLKRSEEALRLALEAGEMGVWDWNIATGEVKWTGSLEKIHGVPEGTFAGTMKAFQDLIHPEDFPRVERDIQNAIATGSRFSTEFRRIFSDQSVHWIGGEGKPFYDETGKPMRLLGIGLDLTPKKMAEQRSAFLAEASRLLSTTLDYEATLQNIANLIVPALADWCFVDLLSEDDQLKTVAFRFTDPKLLEVAKQLQQRYPPDPNSKYGPMNVVKNNSSEMMAEIPDQALVEFAQNQDHLRMLRQLD
ncbi:MAG TPA: PAS domain-containing protein, partial [Acidobacteriota bacterium]|nr:PAS domain-containing protein [Acidobacteriota bacterium]